MLRRRPHHQLLLLRSKHAHATIIACFRALCSHRIEKKASMYGQATKFVRVRIPLSARCASIGTPFFSKHRIAPHRPSRCTTVSVGGRAVHTIPASFLACDWWEHPTSWLPPLGCLSAPVHHSQGSKTVHWRRSVRHVRHESTMARGTMALLVMVLACLVGVRAEEEAVITLDASNFDTGA